MLALLTLGASDRWTRLGADLFAGVTVAAIGIRVHSPLSANEGVAISKQALVSNIVESFLFMVSFLS